MEKKKPLLRTFVQGSISQKEKEMMIAHMDHLGMDHIGRESVIRKEDFEYEFEFDQYPFYITASKDVLKPATQLPMHSHSWMEIFRYASDSRVEYLIGTHRYILQKGDLICVPPGVCHQVLRYEPTDTPCVRDLIVLTPDFLARMGWTSQPGQYYLLRATDTIQRDMDWLCDCCVKEFQNKEFRWRDMITGCIFMLLTQIVRHADLAIQAEADGIFEKLLAYVDENLNQKITLEKTAQIFFTSERTITREFQKNLGISFHRYITQRRMLTASNLIYIGIPLEEVSWRVGYADYPTFYRAFKKEYGKSPREMQQSGI